MFAKTLLMEIIEDFSEFVLFGNYMVFFYCTNDVIFEYEGDIELVSFILN